jgi:DNA invertase Pin-like site-specific DNA recombinase
MAKKKWIALTRVSSRNQRAKGHSHEGQLEAIEAFVKDKGGEICEVVTLTLSGSKMSLNLGALNLVMDSAIKQNASIVISTMDRISRDSCSLHMLRDQAKNAKVPVEIWLASLNQNITDLDPMTFAMMAGYAEQERLMIQKRVKDSKYKSKGSFGSKVCAQDAAQKSKAKRRTNFDIWSDGIKLIEKLDNAVQEIKRPTLHNIAVWLTGLGSTTITGSAWTGASVQSTLKRLGYKNLDEYAFKRSEQIAKGNKAEPEPNLKDEEKGFRQMGKESSLKRAMRRGTFLD